jgi:carboxypeptidase C (cathepsin A)
MYKAALFAVSAALAAQSADAYTEAALADQVTNLPGAEKLDFKFNQFSGYLNIPGVSGEDTKFMHYWFTESEGSSKDPVAFWTNGGPGCSGLIGFMTEQGAFRPDKDMSLSLNEFAWNKVANM